jgi:hypothetical protein
MALIPPDAAIRLRMQTESALSPIAPLKEISADLPDLRPGQTFTARIQQPLPENTYRALVAGREVTLALPGTVNAGDTLELVVVDRSTRMVTAQLASSLPNSLANSPASSEEAEPSGTTQLSPAAQLIGKLLLPVGQQPQPVTLNQGEPLLKPPLPTASNLAAALAPRLEQAATNSGLFYEAHQALWLSGQHSTEALLEEPQAKHAVLLDAKATLTASGTATSQVPNPNVIDRSDTASTAATAGNEIETPAGSKDLMQSIPAELRPLVQQQLDAATTQRLAWQGEVWPGQTMQWQISRETPQQSNTAPSEIEQWNTNLALTTPMLGRIEAALGVANGTVKIRLAADSAVSVSKLNRHLPALKSALEAAGLTPIGLQVSTVKTDASVEPKRDGNT